MKTIRSLALVGILSSSLLSLAACGAADMDRGGEDAEGPLGAAQQPLDDLESGFAHNPTTGLTVDEDPVDEGFVPPEFDGQTATPGFAGTMGINTFEVLGGPKDEVDPNEPAHGHDSIVFGSDSRVRLTPTTSFPNSAICKITTAWPNGSNTVCTGSLIGAKYMLTAGHCVHRIARGGWATSLEVIPGRDGASRPFGTVFGVNIRSVKGWTVDENNDYDYALVTLGSNVGNTTGWFGLASLSDSGLESTKAYITGYPADLPPSGNGQYGVPGGGSILALDSTMVYYRIDTSGGQSGSGVYQFINSNRYVTTVHTGASFFWGIYYNNGTRINSQRFSQIVSWMNSGT